MIKKRNTQVQYSLGFGKKKKRPYNIAWSGSSILVTHATVHSYYFNLWKQSQNFKQEKLVKKMKGKIETSFIYKNISWEKNFKLGIEKKMEVSGDSLIFYLLNVALQNVQNKILI